jgi:tetratricopeptide (TPR) repeat protein
MRKLIVYITLMVGAMAAILVVTQVAALAPAQAPSDNRFDYKVRQYFFAGFTGDSAALEKGMKTCEDLLAANPKNAEALVWHGTGVYFQGVSAFQKGDSQAGGQLVQRGMKEMDEAVALAPNNLGVRIPRGAFLLTASRNVTNPAIARSLTERAVSDLEKAYEFQQDHLDKLGTHPKGELLLGLADGYTRLGQPEKAQPMIDRISAEMKGTRYEASAILWNEKKSLPANQAGCLGCHVGN